MSDPIDYDKIQKMLNDTANTVQIDIMEKTVVKVLKNFGIDNPKKMNRLIIFAEDCMKNKRDMKQGFFVGLGGHVLSFLTTIAAVYVMALQGLFK